MIRINQITIQKLELRWSEIHQNSTQNYILVSLVDYYDSVYTFIQNFYLSFDLLQYFLR